MSNITPGIKPPANHHDKDYHVPWNFRKEAFIIFQERPVSPNLYPGAIKLHAWLRQSGQLHVLDIDARSHPRAYTNPYAYDAVNLSLSFSSIVNDAHSFAHGNAPLDPVDAEIRRHRFNTDYALYSARLCESLIKQMLFCTDFQRSSYKKAALGQLLCQRCPSCWPDETKRHKRSLVGSLACRFGLCREFDGCLKEHIQATNKARNNVAAHSGTLEFNLRPLEEIRAQHAADCYRLGTDFVHILSHLAKIEEAMMEELDASCVAYEEVE